MSPARAARSVSSSIRRPGSWLRRAGWASRSFSLGARGGTGAAQFYERNGWTERGRVQRSLRVDRPDGGIDWRADISFMIGLG